MKKRAFYAVAGIALVLILAMVAVSQQSGAHKVVFHMNTNGDYAWEQALRNINALQGVFGAKNVQIEVVCLGPGLRMIMKTDKRFQERIEKAAASGVVFAACRNTMKGMNVTEADLLAVDTTVDSGVAECVRKQEAGWTYIKSGAEQQVDPATF
jgi:intracellular sulfur oxidation DsrE/DsrF family protein